MEQHQLPGGYYTTSLQKDDPVVATAASSNLPLAIISSVLFPAHENFHLLDAAAATAAAAAASSTLPGAWVPDTHHHHHHHHQQHAPHTQQHSHAVLDDLDPTVVPSPDRASEDSIAELRRTVAELRKQAEQLEHADMMVKKGIEIVAHKRVLVQHQRRQKSQWDWCDSSSSDDDDHDEINHRCQDDPGAPATAAAAAAGAPSLLVADEADGWVWVESNRVAV